MEIRPVDVADDAELGGFLRAYTAGDLHGRPGMPSWSKQECEVFFRSPDPSAARIAYAAFDGDQMVGTGFTYQPLLDNLDKTTVFVSVPPEHRRRGVGGELTEYLVGICHDAGRPVTLMSACLPFAERETHGYRRFAERHGFTLANVEVRRVLELPVTEAQLDEWSAQAAPHHRDYQLTTFSDATPEHLIESLCYLLNQLVLDAPTGDIDFEAEAITPDALREREKLFAASGLTVYSTVAIDRRGLAAGHSAICVDANDDQILMQWATHVHREHRGHRLGLAVKAQNLRAVQRAHPHHKRIITTNAEVNQPMVAINELMGFEPVELLAEFQRKA